MVNQLSTLAKEGTRVSLEVGTEGILGGQANVSDVKGAWKALADNVNLMAVNLRDQVRGIAAVTKAVASGDLIKKVEVRFPRAMPSNSISLTCDCRSRSMSRVKSWN